ncbi:MAG: DUF2852 domain-containing protein [Hyphomicrobiaceae bacterium]|nr:DUF2852 domain-containing protein [Hyphomicrobiaceae bacterium]
MTATTYSGSDLNDRGFSHRDEWRMRKHGCGMGRGRLFRSGWEIAGMVIGFVVFFPIGLAILAFLFWRKWRAAAGQPLKPSMSEFTHGFAMPWTARQSSGNAAFDEYKQAVLDKLREDLRRLEEDQMAFRAFVEQLKRAKDQEEFDRFMSDRAKRRPEAEDPGVSI